jgi:hypothetical protein
MVRLVVFFLAAGIAFVSCKDKKDKDKAETRTGNTTEKTTGNTTGNPKELIINTWTPISTGKKDVANDSAMKLLAGTTYQFTNDGRYIITGLTTNPFVMGYKIGDDGKTIILTRKDGTSDTVIITRIGKDELIITTSAGEKITYSPK